jgi:hypothetical protein
VEWKKAFSEHTRQLLHKLLVAVAFAGLVGVGSMAYQLWKGIPADWLRLGNFVLLIAVAAVLINLLWSHLHLAAEHRSQIEADGDVGDPL